MAVDHTTLPPKSQAWQIMGKIAPTIIWGVSQNSGYLFGVPIVGIIIFWGLHEVPLFWETTIYWDSQNTEP